MSVPFQTHESRVPNGREFSVCQPLTENAPQICLFMPQSLPLQLQLPLLLLLLLQLPLLLTLQLPLLLPLQPRHLFFPDRIISASRSSRPPKSERTTRLAETGNLSNL